MNFTSENIIKLLFKALCITPKYICMEVAGMAMGGCGGGGTSVNPVLLREEANKGIATIDAAMENVKAFAASEQGFVNQIEALDQSMVHTGASEDIEDLTDVVQQTDVASGFAGSGEIADMKETTVENIYDTVVNQYNTIGIDADRERSNIQNTATTALNQLQSQINQITGQFVASTGEAWDQTGTDGITYQTATFDSPSGVGPGGWSYLGGSEAGDNAASAYNLSPNATTEIGGTFNNFTTYSGMAAADHYANPVVKSGIFDDSDLMSTFYGTSNAPNSGLLRYDMGGNVHWGHRATTGPYGIHMGTSLGDASSTLGEGMLGADSNFPGQLDYSVIHPMGAYGSGLWGNWQNWQPGSGINIHGYGSYGTTFDNSPDNPHGG